MNRATRRRLDALEGLGTRRGMGKKFWAEQKKESARRMEIIDEAPKEWRDLVNLFDPDDVADLAGDGKGADEARVLLTLRHGRPI